MDSWHNHATPRNPTAKNTPHITIVTRMPNFLLIHEPKIAPRQKKTKFILYTGVMFSFGMFMYSEIEAVNIENAYINPKNNKVTQAEIK